MSFEIALATTVFASVLGVLMPYILQSKETIHLTSHNMIAYQHLFFNTCFPLITVTLPSL